MRTAATIAALMMLAAACSDGTEPAATTGASTTADATAGTGAATSVATSDPPIATTTTAPPGSTEVTTTDVTAVAAPFDTWITVLASLPTDEYDESEATAIAAAEDASAEVLRSDDYASLNPGFWVVYLGGHDFAWEAEAACPDSVEDCYARYLAGIALDAAIGASTETALVVTAAGDLVVLSTDTGETLRTFDRPIGGDGSFPGPLSLTGDGMSIYYSVGFEDFWFSCDASDGTLMHQDLDGSDPRQVGDGFSPAVSADGQFLLYLAASQCFEDPNEPQFVLAPIDTIVRRNLATGSEDRLTVQLTGDVADGYELWSATWGPEGTVLVLDSDGGLWRHAIAGNEDARMTTGERISVLGTARFGATLVGWDANRELVLYTTSQWQDDEVTTFLHGLDLAGAETATLARIPGPAAFALDRGGEQLLAVARDVVDDVDRSFVMDVDVVQVEW